MGDAAGLRVFVLDDHEVVRRGIADLLGAESDVTVVGEAATAGEALRRIPAARPDVAVLDARLPDGSGIDVCRDIRSALPEVRCLILTSYDDEDAIFAAVMAGASGYRSSRSGALAWWMRSGRLPQVSRCSIRISPSGYSPGCVTRHPAMSVWPR